MNGSVTINYTGTADLNLPATLNIVGDLIVNAPDATVNNSASVSGDIFVNDVKVGTWNELASDNKLTFRAAGKTLRIGSGVKVNKLTLDALDARVTIDATASFENPVEIKKAATVISTALVSTKIDSGVEVRLKADEADEGMPVTGNGEEANINPSEVSQIMKQIVDGMFDDVIFTGEKPLAMVISEHVKSLSKNKEIELEVSNEDQEYGEYKVTLTIGGVTGSKTIEVSKVSVNSQKGLEEAQKFNINEIRIAEGFETDKQILITKKNLVIDGKDKTISAATGMTYSEPNKSVLTVLNANEVKINNLTVDATKVNTAEKWDGVYAVQVYTSTGVVLDNVTLKNADAGLLVNGSEVTVNKITTLDNEFGGIEVSQGSGVTSPATLTVTGNSTHTGEDVYIWTIGDSATVVDEEKQYKSGADFRENKVGYVNFILALEERDVPYTKEVEEEFNSVELVVEGLKANEVKYLAFGLGQPQTASSLEEVASFIFKDYEGAKLNTGNIVVQDGKITINGPLLSEEDWVKVKGENETGTYNITLLTDGQKYYGDDQNKNKITISMYKDGKVELKTKF